MKQKRKELTSFFKDYLSELSNLRLVSVKISLNDSGDVLVRLKP